VSGGEGVAIVPQALVVKNGRAPLVFVELEPGRYQRREVEVGRRFEDRVQILRGLQTGEKIAGSGALLVDSAAHGRR
jgi:Cu(I)/Ag(I) efflux system membrane fusion protein